MIDSNKVKVFSRRKEILGWSLALFVLFIIGFFIARNADVENKIVKRTKILLGTIVEIQIESNNEIEADKTIEKAFAEIRRIDELFSTYKETSPVFKFNNSPDSIIKLDTEIYDLMVLADSITKISNHLFDVSIDNLMRVWGFYSDKPVLPNRVDIESALEKSGWKNLELLGTGLVKKKKSAALNFGAIAKGYAVDKAIEVLRESGIKKALVNAGGEVKAYGKKWNVGIQHPREVYEIIEEVVTIWNNSIATSGDYEQYFEVDEKRYHHILNPKTGFPSSGIQSVSIINKSNAIADALATAVFVMGVKDGMNLIENLNDTEAMIINEKGEIFYSSNFRKFLLSENQ